MAEVTSEWGYVEDLEDVIEDLAGVALLTLHRWGLDSVRIAYVMAALGVVEELLADAEPRPSSGGSGGPGGRTPGT